MRSVSFACCRLIRRSALILALASTSQAGFEVGTQLPRPDAVRGGLVQPRRFALPATQLPEDTRVVVFFYSASWCAPCKQIGAALRKTYSGFRARAPGLQLITYSVDDSPRARSDYLRDEMFPWPAIGPALIDHAPWLDASPGGTPQFQAFVVAADQIVAITPAGPADQVIEAALTALGSTPSP